MKWYIFVTAMCGVCAVMMRNWMWCSCALLDDPPGARDYIDNLMTWSMEELIAYLDRRKKRALCPPSPQCLHLNSSL